RGLGRGGGGDSGSVPHGSLSLRCKGRFAQNPSRRDRHAGRRGDEPGMELLMRRLLAILPVLALAGCFSPDEPLCVFACTEAPHECPSGYECRSDNYCHKMGTSGLCPGFANVDASTDAPADARIDAPPETEGGVDAAIDAPIDAAIDAPD